jgi:branched-chain amino acid transport system substrate-binding protein
MSSTKKAFLFVLILVVGVVGFHHERLFSVLGWKCDFSWLSFKRPEPRELRERNASREPAVIKVGIMGPKEQLKQEQGLLFEGIEFAFEELKNNRPAGGHQFVPVYRDDLFSMTRAEQIATEFLNDPEIAAVIGPWSSGIALSVLPLFHYGGLLTLLPDANANKITALGYENVFRLAPKSSQYAEKMAQVIASDGVKSIVLFNFDNEYGDNLTDAVQNELQRYDVKTLYRQEYDYSCDEAFIERAFAEVARIHPSDAVFIMANVPLWKEAAAILRAQGIKSRLYVSEQAFSDARMLEVPELEGATFFGNVDFSDETVKAFSERFFQRYQVKPDSLAVHGYETVMTLFEGYEKAGTANITSVSDSLKENVRSSLYGKIQFDSNGDLMSPQIVVKRIQNGTIIEKILK